MAAQPKTFRWRGVFAKEILCRLSCFCLRLKGFWEAPSTFLACGASIVQFQFLGISVGANPRRQTTWRPLLDKLRNRLSMWKVKFISLGAHLKHKVANMGDWLENRWVWDVKLAENTLLQEEEDAELDSLLSILQDVQGKRQVDDSFMWWRNKFGFTVECAEAEYRSMAQLAAEILWVQSLLLELHCKIFIPKLLCDNLSTVTLAHNPVLHNRTKHMELDIFFVREKVLSKSLIVEHVPAMDKWADALTKPLSAAKFFPLRDKLRVQQADYVC
ncbi:hypothetical protein KIW84_042214 [Lathyrus oleraceus]|uniref:Uncharacterized protein n=1 Tax=Pisum sativum TaxID=3888 RepID=A0A9D5AMF7_PEA|nr:hypothetical protein KIW84_042214 [Pisum sativum]